MANKENDKNEINSQDIINLTYDSDDDGMTIDLTGSDVEIIEEEVTTAPSTTQSSAIA